MAKVLMLYYSSYGHIERMAYAQANGVRSTGVEADVKCVRELVPTKVAWAAHDKLDQIAPVAEIDDLMGTTPSFLARRHGLETWPCR
jgi:NAD(P)H dehydrogenase (quinone)